MLIGLCAIWGVTWPILKIALNEIPPFSARTVTAVTGTLTLYGLCLVMRRSFRVPSSRAWGYIVVASFLNIIAFSMLSAFAQLTTTTSRVTILIYTIPIWSVLLAWPFLGERPNRMQVIALGLCAAGLTVLVYPLTGHGLPLGIPLAVATGFCWAAGTVYLKWARIQADPMGVAFWQLAIAAVVITAFTFAIDGGLDVGRARLDGWSAVLWTGIVGNGVAYALWFPVIRRLPAVAASLGILSVPVIGVVGSTLLLGELPTGADTVGFALILAASACILLAGQPRAQPSA